jgi:hypothetical protein
MPFLSKLQSGVTLSPQVEPNAAQPASQPDAE